MFKQQHLEKQLFLHFATKIIHLFDNNLCPTTSNFGFNQYYLRLDFHRSLVSGLPFLRRDGWTRERQTMSVTDLLIYYILLGRILQLPRGKGHKRTSRSYSKVPHLHPPPHSHMKDSHSTRITLLFSNSAWVLLRSTELSTFKEL